MTENNLADGNAFDMSAIWLPLKDQFLRTGEKIGDGSRDDEKDLIDAARKELQEKKAPMRNMSK